MPGKPTRHQIRRRRRRAHDDVCEGGQSGGQKLDIHTTKPANRLPLVKRMSNPQAAAIEPSQAHRDAKCDRGGLLKSRAAAAAAAWIHLDSLGFTWIHLDSLGFTWICSEHRCGMGSAAVPPVRHRTPADTFLSRSERPSGGLLVPKLHLEMPFGAKLCFAWRGCLRAGNTLIHLDRQSPPQNPWPILTCPRAEARHHPTFSNLMAQLRPPPPPRPFFTWIRFD